MGKIVSDIDRLFKISCKIVWKIRMHSNTA